MRMAHDVEPFVRSCFAIAVQQLSHAIDENLGAAPGDAVQAGRHEPRDDVRHAELRKPREMDDLGRRQRVQLERRIAILDRAKQILVPGERQVRIVPALQQQLHAADLDRLVDLAEQLVEPEDVAFGRSDRPVERAEVALRHAHVRVVDVAIDDVGDDRLGMFADAGRLRQSPEQRRRRVPIELERLVAGHPAARSDLRRNRIDRHQSRPSFRLRHICIKPFRRRPGSIEFQWPARVTTPASAAYR